MHREALVRAALRGLKPGPPLQDPARLLRVAVGMIVAAIGGYFLHDFEEQVLICVGAFLGGIASLMPHNRSRLGAAVLTGTAEIFAAAAGILLHGLWWLILPVLFIGLFTAGILRVVALSISMRFLVVTIIFVAFAEITPSLPVGARELALFAVGVAVMLMAQLLPPYEPRHAVQRRAVASLYDALASGGPYGPALLAADRSLALLRGRRHREIDHLTELVERGEEIAQLLAAVNNRGDDVAAPWRAAVSEHLHAIGGAIRRRRPELLPADLAVTAGQDRLQRRLIDAITTAARTTAGAPAPVPSDERRPPNSLELVRAELHPASPIVHHALRLAVTGVIGQVIGVAIGAWVGTQVLLHGHGFWVVVAVVLILFPDYGETFARGIGRTVGTLAGAAVGLALSFLPPDPILHTVTLITLFLGYLAFRSCGQPWTMLWVVAWISALTVGPLGAVTRGAETVIGCALAFAAYMLAPTYQRKRLSELLAVWARAEADRLDALDRLSAQPQENHRLEVARATVGSRLARLEIVEAADHAQFEPDDKAGRWTNDDIARAVQAVVETGRQVSVLGALVPGSDRGSGPRLQQETALLAYKLRDLAAPIELHETVPPSDPARAVPNRRQDHPVPDPDLQIAIDKATESISVLGVTLAKQLSCRSV